MGDAKDSIESVCVVDHEILTGSVDGCIRKYDIRLGSLVVDTVGYPVTSAAFSHDNNCILSSSLDSTIRLFDKESGELLNSYKGHVNKEFRISSCLSPTDAFIASGSEDGKAFIWDLVDASIVREIPAHTRSVSCIALNSKRNEMITCSIDGSVKVWVDDASLLRS